MGFSVEKQKMEQLQRQRREEKNRQVVNSITSSLTGTRKRRLMLRLHYSLWGSSLGVVQEN